MQQPDSIKDNDAKFYIKNLNILVYFRVKNRVTTDGKITIVPIIYITILYNNIIQPAGSTYSLIGKFFLHEKKDYN